VRRRRAQLEAVEDRAQPRRAMPKLFIEPSSSTSWYPADAMSASVRSRSRRASSRRL
jgi:hypothetical protein